MTEWCGTDIEECVRERVLCKYFFLSYMNYMYIYVHMLRTMSV